MCRDLESVLSNSLRISPATSIRGGQYGASIWGLVETYMTGKSLARNFDLGGRDDSDLLEA